MSKDLGFGKASSPRRESLDLSGLPAPSAAPPESKVAERVFENAAERAGFKSREPTERVIRSRKSKEAMDSVYLRAPISVINRFKEHCNENDLSYGEALEELLAKAGI